MNDDILSTRADPPPPNSLQTPLLLSDIILLIFLRYRDNIPVVDSHRTKMYEDVGGNTKLVINDIRPEDSGLYFLTAENKAGKAKCAATLRVTGQYGSRVLLLS